MALEMNDLMMLRGLDKEGMTPYEQFKVGHIQSKHASGTAIGALVTGVGAAVLAVGAAAWCGYAGSFYADDKDMRYVAAPVLEIPNT